MEATSEVRGAGLQQGSRQAEAMPSDPDSFRAFYAEALPRVFAYFLYRTGADRQVAEDLTQETFMAAVKEMRAGSPVDSPIGWVLGIARHKLMDHYRARERNERRLEALRSSIDDDGLLTWDGDASRERAVAALDAVAGPQRTALVLRYLDGLSVPETASLIGKSVHATESLLARGRASFRRAYEEGDRG